MRGHRLARITGRRAPRRLYLHISAMKTGTTFLQDLLHANRSQLKTAGFLFPGTQFSDLSDAVREILFDGEDLEVREQVRGKWSRLVEEIRSFEGKAAIVSMEFLSFADPEGAARVIASFPDHEIHVILTVRDAERAIPAQWQTSMRNGSKVTLPRFVQGARQVREGRQPPSGRASYIFQRTQGIPRMLDTWTPLVGAGRVHVVTVPPSGSDPTLLWRRFAKVVGVRPAKASTMPAAANPSLGHPSSELLRRVNKELGRVPTLDYWAVIKAQLARRILGGRAAEEPPVRLHRPGVALARRWNRIVRQSIEEHGVHLVGSLDDLPIEPPEPDLPTKLYRPSDSELLAAAGTAYAGLLELRDRLCAEADVPLRPRTPEPEWTSADDPVDAAVADVVALVRECMALHRRKIDLRAADGAAAPRDVS